MANNKMIKCKACGQDIAKGVKKCIHCGKDQRNFFMRHKILTGLLIFIVITAFGIGSNPEIVSNSTDVETTEKEKPTNETDTKNNTSEVEKSNESNVPREYRSALKKAKVYSDTMNMSKVGVYDQLVSEYGENFPPEAAQYAVDNLESDWNDNALKKAKVYSDTMNMSKRGVYDQLISDYGEKFTEEEAQYAVDNIEADWKANALKKAEMYSTTMSMSNTNVYEQLISDYGEKFTEEEAQYAVDNLK